MMMEDSKSRMNRFVDEHGMVFNPNQEPGPDGVRSVLWNRPVRDRLWKFQALCARKESNQFALLDEHSQVVDVAVQENAYRIAKYASAPVTAVTYMNSRRNTIAVAYENGSIQVIDFDSRETICMFNSKGKSPVRILRSHPFQDILISADDNMVINVYDINQQSRRLLRCMGCRERIVDIDFVLMGECLVVVLEQTGVCVYRVNGFKLLWQTMLPSSERRPNRWTSQLSGILSLPAATQSESNINPERLSHILGADNGCLYVWTVEKFFGAIELPVQMQMPVAMELLCSPVSQAEKAKKEGTSMPTRKSKKEREMTFARIAVMSCEGSLAIIDIVRLSTGALGRWMLMGYWDALTLHGAAHMTVRLSPYIAPPDYGATRGAYPGAHDARTSEVESSRGVPMAVHEKRIAVVGGDGAVRLIDVEAGLGYGVEKHTKLKCRKPEGVASDATHSYFGMDSDSDYDSSSGDDDMSRPSAWTKSQGGGTLGDTKSLGESIGIKSSVADDMSGIGSLRSGSASRKSGRSKSSRRSRSSGPKDERTDAQKAQDAMTAGQSLFRLAALPPKEVQVNVVKLRALLEKYGEFPSRYRNLIWRFLLKLPENNDAFVELVKRGPHSAYDALHRRYSLRSTRLYGRLLGLCSQLAHWAPIFAEVSYVPQFVFPFVIVYGRDELAMLETCMTIFMWWGYGWHATFPNPPVHITDSIDRILKVHDDQLYRHLQRNNVSPGLIGWMMISSMFTEVLSQDDWLKLMDHLFAYFKKTAMLVLTPVALMINMRSALMTTDEELHITNFCRRQQGFNMSTVIKHIFNMMKSTPSKLLSACVTFEMDVSDVLEGKTEADNTVSFDDEAKTRKNMALHAGHPIFPLTTGRYPAYDGYPKYLVDWEIKKRERGMKLEQEVKRREDVLADLQAKIAQVEQEHSAWMAKHEAASESELRHRRTLIDAERASAQELLRIEEAISEARIASLTSLETISNEEVQMLERAAGQNKTLLEEMKKHMEIKMNSALTLQKHREMAQTAESVTQQKIAAMHISRAKEDFIKGLSVKTKSQEAEMESQVTAQREAWDAEDDALRMKRLQMINTTKSLADKEKAEEMQADAMHRLRELHIERQSQITNMERIRAMRILQEQHQGELMAEEISLLERKRREAEYLSAGGDGSAGGGGDGGRTRARTDSSDRGVRMGGVSDLAPPTGAAMAAYQSYSPDAKATAKQSALKKTALPGPELKISEPSGMKMGGLVEPVARQDSESLSSHSNSSARIHGTAKIVDVYKLDRDTPENVPKEERFTVGQALHEPSRTFGQVKPKGSPRPKKIISPLASPRAAKKVSPRSFKPTPQSPRDTQAASSESARALRGEIDKSPPLSPRGAPAAPSGKQSTKQASQPQPRSPRQQLPSEMDFAATMKPGDVARLSKISEAMKVERSAGGGAPSSASYDIRASAETAAVDTSADSLEELTRATLRVLAEEQQSIQHEAEEDIVLREIGADSPAIPRHAQGQTFGLSETETEGEGDDRALWSFAFENAGDDDDDDDDDDEDVSSLGVGGDDEEE